MATLLCVALMFTDLTNPQPAVATGVPLSEAIATFNAESANHPTGRDQMPLTEDEVVGAIRLWNAPEDSPVDEVLLAKFRAIAETGELPPGAEFETLTGYDLGGEHVFDVWSVRIRIARPDESSYAFIIRQRVIGSRTLQQELARLEAMIAADPNGIRQVGGYRIQNRVDDLKRRIAEQEAQQ